MILALTVAVWLATQAPAAQASDGAAIAASKCASCHGDDLIRAQRLSRAGWTRTVDKMVRWGAPISDAEREALVAHLVTRFGPRPVAVRAGVGETIFKAACLICHEADIVEAQRLTPAAWRRTVDKMIRWGAAVPAADRDALVEFLAGR